MKITLLLAAISILGCVYCQSHNVYWGQINWSDYRAFNTNVTKNSSFMSVVEKLIDFPPRVGFFYPKMFWKISKKKNWIFQGIVNYRPISAIRAFDKKTNGNGAFVTIVSGGINSTTTRLRFKSKTGHGINFTLEIYTR